MEVRCDDTDAERLHVWKIMTLNSRDKPVGGAVVCVPLSIQARTASTKVVVINAARQPFGINRQTPAQLSSKQQQRCDCCVTVGEWLWLRGNRGRREWFVCGFRFRNQWESFDEWDRVSIENESKNISSTEVVWNWF